MHTTEKNHLLRHNCYESCNICPPNLILIHCVLCKYGCRILFVLMNEVPDLYHKSKLVLLSLTANITNKKCFQSRTDQLSHTEYLTYFLELILFVLIGFICFCYNFIVQETFNFNTRKFSRSVLYGMTFSLLYCSSALGKLHLHIKPF